MGEKDLTDTPCTTTDNCSNIHLISEALPKNNLVIKPVDAEDIDIFSNFLQDLGWLDGEELDPDSSSVILFKSPENDTLFTITNEEVFRIEDIENIPQIGVFIAHLGHVFYFNNGCCIPDSKLTGRECEFVSFLNRYILGKYHIKGVKGRATILESVKYLN
jgi:hypothetical protein